MNNYVDSHMGCSEGSVDVFMYRWNKNYKPGNFVKIRVFSYQLKLCRVYYFWDNGEKSNKNILMNHFCWFWARVPKFKEPPVLKVVTVVEFKDGTKCEKLHTFEINNM